MLNSPSSNLRSRKKRDPTPISDTIGSASDCPVLSQDERTGPTKIDIEPVSTEKTAKKIWTRTIVGFIMVTVFLLIIWSGHLYVTLMVAAIQAELFRELVRIRYKEAQERSIPLFRTLQWGWFFTAMFYSHGSFVTEFCQNHSSMSWLRHVTAYHGVVSFSLYTILFVGTVLTFRPGHYRYQFGVFMWTILSIGMIVGQMNLIMKLIYRGLIWFTLPTGLVILNDVAAYFCGISFGKRWIKYPFLSLSPKKSWEGVIGACVCTLVFAFFWSKLLASFSWMTCPAGEISFNSSPLSCQVNPIFSYTSYLVPVLQVEVVALPIQFHALAYGLFASIVAPFGGFLASAIKRAYDMKDFDSLIPGHGGVMDRMDCQLIMILFTQVHYLTFVASSSSALMTSSDILTSLAFLSTQELTQVQEMVTSLLNK